MLAAAYLILFVEPSGSPRSDLGSQAVTLALFCAAAAAISWMSESLHRARRRAQLAERNHRTGEAFHRAIAELSSDFAFAGTVRPDGSNTVTGLTDGFTRLFGFTIDEARALGGWRALVHPDDAPLAADVVAKLQRGETAEGNARLRAKDGEYRWLRFRVRPVADEHSGFTVYGAATDITRQKDAEIALRESEERERARAQELEATDQRKNEFLATLAHELRNPLAPIRTAVEVMGLSGPLSPTLESARDVIGRQVRQMVRLVDDLLDVSRINRDQLQIRREHVELSAVLQRAIETSSPTIDAAGHRLHVSVPPQPVRLFADPTRLAQIVANLLNNAAKYMPDPGLIRLVVTSSGNELTISVRDHGIGIEPQHLERIFEMFSRNQPPLPRVEGGPGIGLSLVRRLVEMHGGMIEALSEGRGRGSEIVLRLPIVTDLPATQAPGNSAAPATTAASARVLVVDDNRDAADSLAQLLRLQGHEVYTVYDGAAAIAAFTATRPTLVLLDIGLPDISGYDVARRIRSLPSGRDTLLVAVTGVGPAGGSAAFGSRRLRSPLRQATRRCRRDA